MDVWLSLLFSLVLTGLVSFTIPLVLCFILVGSFNLFAQVNLMSAWADVVSVQLWDFFRTFGEGSGLMGIWTIALTGAIAGLMFEGLSFYRHLVLNRYKNSASWQTHSELLSQIICKQLR